MGLLPWPSRAQVLEQIWDLKLVHFAMVRPSEPPPEFCCPISEEVMEDPVILVATGKTTGLVPAAALPSEAHAALSIVAWPCRADIRPQVHRELVGAWAQSLPAHREGLGQ